MANNTGGFKVVGTGNAKPAAGKLFSLAPTTLEGKTMVNKSAGSGFAIAPPTLEGKIATN